MSNIGLAVGMARLDDGPVGKKGWMVTCMTGLVSLGDTYIGTNGGVGLVACSRKPGNDTGKHTCTVVAS